MKIEESKENYLETILVLENRTGFVRSIDIAIEMGFSKPSVSSAMKKLRAEGYIEVEDKGRIVLTAKGKSAAEETYERHCVISEILMHLGVDKTTALDDACRMEHIVSSQTFDCFKSFLDALKKPEENEI